MPRCSGDCKYEEVWVDNLRNFETWTIHWFTREITIVKQVTPQAQKTLEDHAASLGTDTSRVGHWLTECAKGCRCDGAWQAPTVTEIPLRVVDHVRGVIVMCTADMHKRAYVGTCKDAG